MDIGEEDFYALAEEALATLPEELLDDLENGRKVAETPVDKVRRHYRLGHQFGVNGTPAIITPKGALIPGYVKADEMLKTLQEEGDSVNNEATAQTGAKDGKTSS